MTYQVMSALVATGTRRQQQHATAGRLAMLKRMYRQAVIDGDYRTRSQIDRELESYRMLRSGKYE